MQRELIYFPVERYASRWTEYVSGENGMFADCVGDYGGVTLRTVAPDDDLHKIEQGVVLDTRLRASFGFYQVEWLLKMIQRGDITNDSVLYIEDFWLPGMEMIPYACHLKGIRPRVYAYCHAQSCDPNDFTAGMAPWIRGFERGWASWLTGIFVAAKELKQMLAGCDPYIVFGSKREQSKVHVVGTVMHRQTLIDKYYPGCNTRWHRAPLVLFTSRMDDEKNPHFFFDVVKRVGSGSYNFLLSSGRRVSDAARQLAQVAGVAVVDDTSKIDYFARLSKAAVMFNSAKQDFVGYCQLDALAYGCAPLCPDYLSFPDLFAGDKEKKHLYDPGNVDDAAKKLIVLVEEQIWKLVLVKGNEVPELYTRFGQKYEGSVARMLDIMFAEPSLEDRIDQEYGC